MIRGNLIRGVYHQGYGAFGIWMDWGNQGTRITGNIIYNTQAANIYLEMDHGPILVDNNVLIGQGVKSWSEGDVFAHNLLVDCAFDMASDTSRQSQYYRPHSRIVVARKPGVPADDKWYNNIFIRRGLDGVKKAPGYASDFNVFLEGAKKSSFGDEHSIVDPSGAAFRREDSPRGVSIALRVDQAPLALKGPWVDGSLIGVLPTAGQTIEDFRGRPIRVDADIFGKQRAARSLGRWRTSSRAKTHSSGPPSLSSVTHGPKRQQVQGASAALHFGTANGRRPLPRASRQKRNRSWHLRQARASAHSARRDRSK